MVASLFVYPCVSDRGSCPGWPQSHSIAEDNHEISIWYVLLILDVVDMEGYEDGIISKHLQQHYSVTAGDRPWFPLLLSLSSLLCKL